jgi:hypothetical protein
MTAVYLTQGDNVETLQRQIGGLVGERQVLRAGSADRDTLERNRREIADLQQRLSLALIARHLVPAPSPAF